MPKVEYTPEPVPVDVRATDHYLTSAQLLTPPNRWNGRFYEQQPVNHENQRKASIHSNLAKIEAMETGNIIEYAKLLHTLGYPVGTDLLAELHSRIERTYRNGN
ncbi:hypothetical protein BJD78_gp93 [Arthrobacter phage KellEzio]|uniref:Uncharacterized protein n=1 Tax=Arthrobacter phage KellEzio TaxID=1796995 RepID=A0A140G6H8_9CAUD|nr:hypothetical protein BJD78_gp93 [Arthrobacter phage KellEzio]AMM44263.1 hypothetical protein KELLEZIO_93 [Arthrobacter phage KellEzio]